MDAASSGGGDDERGLEGAICEDEGVRRYLEEFMGAEGFEGFDDDFIDEFRKSDSFAEMLREVGLEHSVGGGSSHSNTSRRPSLNESDRGTVRGNPSQHASNTGVIHPDPPQKETTPPPPPVASNLTPGSSRQSQGSKSSEKKIKKKKKTKEGSRRRVVVSDSPSSFDSDGDDSGSQFSRKLSDKLKIRPMAFSATAVPSSKKDKVDNTRKKPSRPSQERSPSNDFTTKKTPKIELKSESPPKTKRQNHPDSKNHRIEEPVKDEEKKEYHQFLKDQVGCLRETGLLYLVDLLAMTNLFPNGLKENIKITPRLLREITECERIIMMSKPTSLKKCIRPSHHGEACNSERTKESWASHQHHHVKRQRQVPKPKTLSYKDIVKGSLHEKEHIGANPSGDNLKKKETATKFEKASAKSVSLTAEINQKNNIDLESEPKVKETAPVPPKKKPNPFGVVSFASLEKLKSKVKNEPSGKTKQKESSTNKDKRTAEDKEHVIVITNSQKSPPPLSEKTTVSSVETLTSTKGTSNKKSRKEAVSMKLNVLSTLTLPQLAGKLEGPKLSESERKRSSSPAKKKMDETVVTEDFAATTDPVVRQAVLESRHEKERVHGSCAEKEVQVVEPTSAAKDALTLMESNEVEPTVAVIAPFPVKDAHALIESNEVEPTPIPGLDAHTLIESNEMEPTVAVTAPIPVTGAHASIESDEVDVEQLSKEPELIAPETGTVQEQISEPLTTPPLKEVMSVEVTSIENTDEKSEKSLSVPAPGILYEEPKAQVDDVHNLKNSLPQPPSAASLEKEVTSTNAEIDENPVFDQNVDVDTEMPSPPPSPTHSHPGDDSQEPSSPEITEPKKSSSPDRVMPKKKNVIESSSDDGDNRKEETDITDGDDHDSPPDEGKNKSSDDEVTGSKKSVRFAHNPSIQRERDQEDTRSGKFGEFEMERLRKKEKKRGPKSSKEKTDPLEKIMKDTQLCGFRIPRKTTSNRRTDSIAVSTPLTIVAAEVSKENLRFERFRKGLSDKDKLEKKEKGEWNNKNRGSGGDWNSKNSGGDSGSNNDLKGDNNKMTKEPGPFDRHKLRDEGRIVLLAPTDENQGEGEETVVSSTVEGGRDDGGLAEPDWEDDGPTGGDSPDMGGDDDNGDDNEVGGNKEDDEKKKDDKGKQKDYNKDKQKVYNKDKQKDYIKDNEKDDYNKDKGKNDTLKKYNVSADKHSVDLQRVKVEKIKSEKVEMTPDADSTETTEEEEAILLNPEVPIKTVEINPFSVGAMMLLQQDPNPELPDVDEEKNLAESTMIKLAWWISKSDLENSIDSESGNDWYKVDHVDGDSSDGGASEGSYLEKLECSMSEDDEILHSLPREIQRRTIGPVDEFCGRQLLQSRYRSGPEDKFADIFQTRGGVTDKSYLRENFQTRCTLCDQLVVGKTQLANHVVSDFHREKMSQAGLSDIKSAESSNADKQKDKNVDVKKSVADSTSSEDKHKKDGERKDKDKKKEEDKHKRKDKKRKRSKSKEESSSEKSRNESGAEVGVTSTGLAIKIPAGAIPDKNMDKDSKNRPDSKEQRSRSRSPRHKRNRSLSRDRDRPRKSRSRSPPGSSRRRRSRSRDRTERNRAREPIVRISRSPAKLRENRRGRSRSTSAERVQKFLARTQRRSRSPSNAYRKRHRHGTPPKDIDVLPKKTNREFHEKLMLTADGKWTDELESKWKVMEVEEAIFMEQFGEKSKKLKTTPEGHPEYAKEWSEFWERRYQEIEEEGKEDPDKHNYVPEWKEFWNKKLRDFLDKEYEDGINAIKVRHGVDILTLQKIRNTPKEPIVMQLKPNPPPVIEIPRPVPPPFGLPMGVPPPQIFMAQLPSIQGTITPSSKSVSDIGEDMTARSMSISDSGEDRLAKPAAPSPAVTTVDLLSTWEKLTTGGGVPNSKQGSSNSGGPPPPAQQPLRSLSISKSIGERSVADSLASIESYTFTSGMDVAQVLRIMTNLEDQLSFFAPKVQEYFNKAEELDLKQRNKSYNLLKDADFVAMMFQIRDRFMAQIRAHVLPKGILDQLNLAVYGLNGILDHPDCQSRRPKHIEIEKPPEQQQTPPKQKPPAQPSTTSSKVNVNDTFTRPVSKSHQYNPLRNLSQAKKEEISVLLTHFLLTMGRDDVSDGELKEMIVKMTSQQSTSTSSSARNSASNTPQNRRSGHDSDSSARSIRFGETSSADPWRPPERNVTKLFSVASVHGAGTAMPELSTSIPHPPYQNPNPSSGGGSAGPRFGSGNVSGGGEGGGVRDGGGFGRGSGYCHGQYEGAGDNYMSSGSSVDGGPGGRHSPFSRRDFTGNPAYSNNSYYDKIARASAQKEKRHPSTSTKENNPAKRMDGMPVVTVGTTSRLTHVKKTFGDNIIGGPEIQMTQLTKYKEANQPNMSELKDKDRDGRGAMSSYQKNISDFKYGHVGGEATNVKCQKKMSKFDYDPGGDDRGPSDRRTSLDLGARSAENNDNGGKTFSIVQGKMSGEDQVVLEESQHNLPKLPPGIMNMIIRERNIKAKQAQVSAEIGEILSDVLQDDDDSYYYRRKRKRKRKKRKESRARRTSSSSSSSSEDDDDSDESKHARDRSKERRRRRERRKKKSRKESESSSSSIKSVSPSPDERKSSCRRQSSGSYHRHHDQSRSRHSNYQQNRSGSRKRENYSPSPARETRRGRESGSRSRWERRRLSHSEAEGFQDGLECILPSREPPTSLHESDWENPDENVWKEKFPCDSLPDKPPRIIPPPTVELSDGEWECTPASAQDNKPLLRESNLNPRSKTIQKRLNAYDMFAPSPPASMNSGSSGYRRTRERRNVTTINVPGSRPLPRTENWEEFSDVSSLGEKRKGSKTDIPTSQKHSNENLTDPKRFEVLKNRAQVTSVSKTFWTTDNDDKSLSSVSSSSTHASPTKQPFSTLNQQSHNRDEKKPASKQVSSSTGADATAVSIPVPISDIVGFEPRRYRLKRLDVDKEPGELSTCSSSENFE